MTHSSGTKNTIRSHKLTLFVVLSIICAGFILIGNIFLIVVRDAQVRLIDASLDTVPTLIGAALPHMANDSLAIQSFVAGIGDDIPGLVQLDVVLQREGALMRVASLHELHPLETVSEQSNTVRVAQVVPGQVARVIREDGYIDSVYVFKDVTGESLGYVEATFRQDTFAPSVDRNVVRTMILLLSLLGITIVLLIWFIGTGEHRRLLKQTKRVTSVYEELLEKIIHEVQTPLTVIAGYTTMLANLEADAIAKKHVAQIKHAVQQLQRFVAHASYATQLEQQSIVPNLVSVNPVTIVHSVIEIMQKKYNHLNPQITCTAKSSDSMLVDQRQFAFVLEQVLHNAVFHGGGAVAVRIDAEGGDVIVRVSDQGVRAAGVEHEQVTKKWYRGASNTAQLRGSGLGMWITERLLTRMHGSLRITKNEGAGTTVEIRVPRTL